MKTTNNIKSGKVIYHTLFILHYIFFNFIFSFLFISQKDIAVSLQYTTLSTVVSGIMRTFCFSDRLFDGFQRYLFRVFFAESFDVHILSRSPFSGRNMP